MILKKDKFVKSLLGINSYTIIINSKFNKLSDLQNISTPSFYTLKSKYPIPKSIIKKINAKFICKHYTFIKRYKKSKQRSESCRLVKKTDFKTLKKISLEQTSNSHFVQDKNLPLAFRKNFRFNWFNNYFKNKRGDFLIVHHDKSINGFLLLIKEKKIFKIDLIVTSKKKRKLGIGKALINYVNDFYLRKTSSYIKAGTQSNNLSAIKFYKKLKFKKILTEYIYHIYKN